MNVSEFDASLKLSNPGKVHTLIKSILDTEDLKDQEKEHFWVIGLKSNNHIRFINLITLGLLNASLVHPREVFKPAIDYPSISIILVHNHPSGETNPSIEDKDITTRLVEAGKILEIPVTDHIIVTNDSYYSFKEKELI